MSHMKTDLGHMDYGSEGEARTNTKETADKCGSIACDSDSRRLATIDTDLVITKTALWKTVSKEDANYKKILAIR